MRPSTENLEYVWHDQKIGFVTSGGESNSNADRPFSRGPLLREMQRTHLLSPTQTIDPAPQHTEESRVLPFFA